MTEREEIGNAVLYRGDCRDILAQLSGVALVATSPPYNCGKDYGTWDDSLSWEEYWGFARAWLVAAEGSLIDGGRLAVNLPWWMGKKPRRDATYEFRRLADEAGLLFLDKIIWIKGGEANVHVSGGFGGGGCGWGTYLSPSGPAIRCASEPILVFSKGSRGRGVVSGQGRGACVRGDMTKEEFHAWTIDTWFLPGASDKEHPAVFPVTIPTRLAKLYTYPGELVVDPFMGVGNSGVACAKAGRRFVGIEIDSRFFDIACRRIEEAQADMFSVT